MTKTAKITRVAILSAAAFILQVLGSIMGLKVAGFLEIEISDLPAIIGTFALGPFSGVMIELIKNVLHLSMSSTGFVGELANFVVNGTYVLVAGLIYKRNKTKLSGFLSLMAGTVMMSVMGIFSNLYLMLPLYMASAPFMTKLNLVLYTITPFNLVKGFVLAIITMLLYKRLRPLLK